MKLVPEPYQHLGTNFLLAHERALLLAGMGTGKCAMTLSALNRKFMDGEIRAVLIIAPKRVAQLTWPNEVRKWDQFRWMKVEVLRGQKPSGRAQIYCINYEQLPSLANLDFCDGIVVDEITRAKNPKSKRIKALRELLKNHFRWGLTGTPRPNSLLELFGQVRLLDEGQRLGPSFAHFQQTWFSPDDYMEYSWSPKEGSEEAIYRKIEDMTLTLRSSDYLNVPDFVVEDVDVTLPDQSRKDYETMERDLLLSLGSDDIVALNSANLAGKLHQMTGGCAYNENKGVVQIHDAKIKALKSVLKSLGKDRALIGCNYVHERELICRSIAGATDASTVTGDVEARWNAGEFQYLVADPRSMGHGLNLQDGGRTIVWYSLPWSREAYDQFCGRVKRKGQALQPLLFRLICTNTIDDAIAETLRTRGDGQNEMLEILTNLRKLRLAA